jgi:hypothetical protein
MGIGWGVRCGEARIRNDTVSQLHRQRMKGERMRGTRRNSYYVCRTRMQVKALTLRGRWPRPSSAVSHKHVAAPLRDRPASACW